MDLQAKQALREKLIVQRRTLLEKKDRLNKILSLLEEELEKSLPDIQNIFCFSSTDIELPITQTVFNFCKKHTKNFALPIVANKKSRMMRFFKVTTLADLKAGFSGILEPKADEQLRMDPDSKTLIIVPALAVNPKNYRIGFGAGFYDLYLKNHIYFLSISCVFKEEIIPFAEEHFDINIDRVISA